MAEHMPESLGFKAGNMSVHTKRTMMLNDLALALERVPKGGTPADYFGAILEDNVLGKPTRSTRESRRTGRRTATGDPAGRWTRGRLAPAGPRSRRAAFRMSREW